MDREEMRFHLVRDLISKSGLTVTGAIMDANEVMAEFDKTRPNYVDPEALESVIQERINVALAAEQDRLRQKLLRRLQEGVFPYYGGNGMEMFQPPHSMGMGVRFSSKEAEHFVKQVIP